MTSYNGILIYDIVLKDEELTHGVSMVSMVDSPAIGVDWIRLSEEDEDMFFSLTETGICLGCPPNGDGTRKDGEPDRRCSDGSSNSSSSKSTKSGTKSKEANPKSSQKKDPVVFDDKTIRIPGEQSVYFENHKGERITLPKSVIDDLKKYGTSESSANSFRNLSGKRISRVKYEDGFYKIYSTSPGVGGGYETIKNK